MLRVQHRTFRCRGIPIWYVEDFVYSEDISVLDATVSTNDTDVTGGLVHSSDANQSGQQSPFSRSGVVSAVNLASLH